MTLYQPGIPTGTVDLDQDYINIQNNFQQLETTYSIDHVGYSVSENNGYHKSVHMVPEPSTPAAIPGVGQLYDRTINLVTNDQTLFFLTGDGKNLQLTSNFVPTIGTSGNTFVAGGLIVKWGFVNGSHGGPVPPAHFDGGDSAVVTFSAAFPTACSGVQINTLYSTNTPSSTATVSYDRDTLSATGFRWFISTSSSSYTRFFWIAIGS